MVIEVEATVRQFKSIYRRFLKTNEELEVLVGVESSDSLKSILIKMIDIKYELIEKKDDIVEQLESTETTPDDIVSNLDRDITSADMYIKAKREEIKSIYENELDVKRRHEEKLNLMRLEDNAISKTNIKTEVEELPEETNFEEKQNSDDNKQNFHEIQHDVGDSLSMNSLLEKFAEMQTHSNMNVIETMFDKFMSLKNQNSSESHKPMIQLSKLDPPTWNGNIRDYFDFKYRFVAVMDKGKINDDYVKMTYLIKSIKNDMYLDRVKNCQSIDIVWNTLERHITKIGVYESLSDDFKDLKPVLRKDWGELVKFTADLSTYCRRITDLGMKECLETIDFVLNVMRKLSGELSRDVHNAAEIEARFQNKTTEEILNVEFIILRLERIARDFKGNKSELPWKSGKNYQKPHSIFSNQRDSEKDTNLESCSISTCSYNHNLENCDIFKKLTYDEKVNHIYKNKFCFRCLKREPPHIRSNCQSNKTCRICKKDNHHELLHKSFSTNSFNSQDCPINHSFENTMHIQEIDENEFKSDLSEGNHVNQTYYNTSAKAFIPQGNFDITNCVNSKGDENGMTQTALLPHLSVLVLNNYGSWVRANVLIDGGSNCTLIRRNFADCNGLDREKTNIVYEVVGGTKKREDTFMYQFHIKSLDDSVQRVIQAYGITKPCGVTSQINTQFLNSFEHLKCIANDVYCPGGDVDILIGRDLQEFHIEKEIIMDEITKFNDPIAVKFPLGWCIVGRSCGKNIKNVNFLQTSYVSDEAYEDISTMFMCDQTGVAVTKKCICTEKEIEESRFLRLTKNSIKLNEYGRVEVEHPWKENFPQNLPNNYIPAKMIFVRQYENLKKACYFKEYCEEMEELIKNDVVQKVPEIKIHDKRFFITHHGIWKPERTSTKLRIVWNSSKKFNGISLNDGLEKGPDLINSLFEIMIKWRKDKFALAGDIRKMFNQVMISEKDRPFLSFFWQKPDQHEPEIYEWMRLLFGNKPSPDLSFSSIQFLAENNKSDFPCGSKVLKKSTYVDDVMSSSKTIEHTIEVGREVSNILNKGSFQIKKWHSNSVFIEQELNKDNLYETSMTVLGHLWLKDSDLFDLKLKDFEDIHIVTKRFILTFIASICDPLGLKAPILVNSKIPFQELWKLRYDWDEILPDEETNEWLKRFEIVKQQISCLIPRCLKPSEGKVVKTELHTFSDGSERGYGACSFLRFYMDNGEYEVKFVASKALVVPVKGWSIPRTELVGLLVASRLAFSIISALEDENINSFYWVDSKVVIYWVKFSKSNHKAFVETRINEILEKVNPNNLFYIPSSLNPADVLTKTNLNVDLVSWYEGPIFLKDEFDINKFSVSISENEFTSNDLNIRKPKKTRKKIIKPRKINSLCSFGTKLRIHEDENLNEILEVATNAISWSDAQNRVHKLNSTEDIQSPFERKIASEKIFRALQFGEGIGEQKYSWYKLLCPFLDESVGIWKMGSRISKFDNLPSEILTPIILPKVEIPKVKTNSENSKFYILEMILRDFHEKGLHLSASRIISNIHRSGLWVVNAKKLLKYVQFYCSYCRKQYRPLLEQKMGFIPQFRFQPYSPVFENTSVDMFGPVNVRLNRKNVVDGNIALFVCLVTRTIHMEICYNDDGGKGLSTDMFLSAFRRFSCSRGIQSALIFADQGSNFMGAISKIEMNTTEWNKTIAEELSITPGRSFTWISNCPTASHMNGCTERMVRWARKALDASINYHVKDFYPLEWITYLSEITYLINSRPLFPFNASNPLDEDGYICPNSILYGHNIFVPQYSDSKGFHPRRHIEYIQKFIQIFWDNFIRLMPQILAVRTKWLDNKDNLHIGDFVIIKKDGINALAPRAIWETAIVIKTYPGKDGLVRKVRIRTRNGEYERPIHKLCLIATNDEILSGHINSPDANLSCDHLINISTSKKGEC